MNSVVEDIKARINVVDLIGEYVRTQKAGAHWRALCPFHREKTPSFMINEEKQIWHCFGCGKGGDAFGFLMEIESIDFKEALKILADKTGVEIPVYNKGQREHEDDKKKTLEILELATKFYEKQLWDGIGKEKIIPYLTSRGLVSRSIKEFRLGYAPSGWDTILKFLTGRGYTPDEIAKTGLLVAKSATQNSRFYDRFRDRIMFPVMDVMGQVVGFSARIAPGGDETQAKYVNTPETAVYHKSKVLYGLHMAKQEIKNQKSTVLVEGNVDVIAAHQAGIQNVVAASGTALTPEHVDTLKRYSNKINMLFDMDSAGEKATERSAEICFQKDMNVAVITLPEGKDAAELVQKDPKKFIAATQKATPIMDYFFQHSFSKHDPDNVEDRKIIVSDLLNIIKNFGNAIEKNYWIRKLAEKIDVNEEVLLETLKKAQKRIVNAFRSEDPKEKKVTKSRTEILQEKIIGIALSDPMLWKEFLATESNETYLVGNPYAASLHKGPEVGYVFEKLLSATQDKDERDFLQKAYFDATYSGEEEIDSADLREQLSYCCSELKKETGKKRLNSLLRDIRRAEEEGDTESKNILIHEFDKLSKEIR